MSLNRKKWDEVIFFKPYELTQYFTLIKVSVYNISNRHYG